MLLAARNLAVWIRCQVMVAYARSRWVRNSTWWSQNAKMECEPDIPPNIRIINTSESKQYVYTIIYLSKKIFTPTSLRHSFRFQGTGIPHGTRTARHANLCCKLQLTSSQLCKVWMQVACFGCKDFQFQTSVGAQLLNQDTRSSNLCSFHILHHLSLLGW